MRIEDCIDLLEYNKSTGDLIWKCGQRKGMIAGSDNGGYIRVKCYGKNFYAHRIIWYMIHGYHPQEIDHINGIKHDNRIANLRDVSRSLNCFNKPCNSNTGLRGVYFRKDRQKYTTSITKDGVTYYLGQYDSKEEAYKAYCDMYQSLLGDFSIIGLDFQS
jgi:hypothetical protein